MGTAAIPAAPASSPTSSTSGEAPKSFSEILEASAQIPALIPAGDPGTPGTTSPVTRQASPQQGFSATAGTAASRAKLSNVKSQGTTVSGQPVPTPIASSMPQPQLTSLVSEALETGSAQIKDFTPAPSGSTSVNLSAGSAPRNEEASVMTAAADVTGGESASQRSGFTPQEAMSSDAAEVNSTSESSSNAKTGDSQTQRAALSPTPASSLDFLSKTASSPRTQPANLSLSDSKIATPKVASASSTPVTNPNAVGLNAADSNIPAPSGMGTAPSVPMASPSDSSTTVGLDAKQSAAISNVVAGSSALATEPGMQSSGASIAQPDASSGANNNNNETRSPAPAKSEADQSAVQLSVIPTSLTFPLAATALMGAANLPNSQGSASLSTTLSAPISSRISATSTRVKPETAGTGNKTTEAPTGTKIQSRQEPSTRGDSQTPDQNNSNVPLKAGDTSASSSAAGSLFAVASGDSSKNTNAASSPVATEPPTSQLGRESTGVAPHPSQPETPAAYPTSLINSAKLVERIGETELHLGMRTGEFGNVDIRTSMVRNQFSAEISVERGELGRVMAADLPGLQNRLSEQRVTVANLTVQDHSGNQSTASEQQKPREGQPEGQTSYTANSAAMRDRDQDVDRTPALVALGGIATPASRLDIHM